MSSSKKNVMLKDMKVDFSTKQLNHMFFMHTHLINNHHTVNHYISCSHYSPAHTACTHTRTHTHTLYRDSCLQRLKKHVVVNPMKNMMLFFGNFKKHNTAMYTNMGTLNVSSMYSSSADKKIQPNRKQQSMKSVSKIHMYQRYHVRTLLGR